MMPVCRISMRAQGGRRPMMAAMDGLCCRLPYIALQNG